MTLAKPIPAVPVCGLNLQPTSMIHPDTHHDPWFGRQRYTTIHPDHVVSLSRPGVRYVCTHRSSQASYIDRIWFTESIIHQIQSYTSCHYYGFPGVLIHLKRSKIKVRNTLWGESPPAATPSSRRSAETWMAGTVKLCRPDEADIFRQIPHQLIGVQLQVRRSGLHFIASDCWCMP